MVVFSCSYLCLNILVMFLCSCLCLFAVLLLSIIVCYFCNRQGPLCRVPHQPAGQSYCFSSLEYLPCVSFKKRDIKHLLECTGYVGQAQWDSGGSNIRIKLVLAIIIKVLSLYLLYEVVEAISWKSKSTVHDSTWRILHYCFMKG